MTSIDDPALVTDFRSDRDSGKSPFRREKAYPELRDGMSVFGPLEAARAGAMAYDLRRRHRERPGSCFDAVASALREAERDVSGAAAELYVVAYDDGGAGLADPVCGDEWLSRGRIKTANA